MKSYLVQRASFLDREGKEGIDSILRFDYMGSSEFEWGALPKSLKAIRENLNEYDDCDLNINGKEITVFYHKDRKDEAIENILALASDELRLKEYCDLKHHIYESKINRRTNDFWWDINNHFMFWKKSDDFHLKFIDAINHKKD